MAGMKQMLRRSRGRCRFLHHSLSTVSSVMQSHSAALCLQGLLCMLPQKHFRTWHVYCLWHCIRVHKVVACGVVEKSASVLHSKHNA